MLDDAFVLRVERLRDEVEQLRQSLRKRYATAGKLVSDHTLRQTAAQLGERWLVEAAPRSDVKLAIGQEVLGSANVAFQRLITCSESSAKRSAYDSAIAGILREFRNRLIVPLKLARVGEAGMVASPPASGNVIFIGHSFASADASITTAVRRVVEACGFRVLTGERPRAEKISEKVKRRIEEADLFLGLFTRRDRLGRKKAWNTSAWVIDEKAYAYAKGKTLILIKEEGVESIGGIQGDYEYIPLERGDLVEPIIALVIVLLDLKVTATGGG